jgi:hypothetical protein
MRIVSTGPARTEEPTGLRGYALVTIVGSTLVPTHENSPRAARSTPSHHPSESRALASSWVVLRGPEASLVVRTVGVVREQSRGLAPAAAERLLLEANDVAVQHAEKIWGEIDGAMLSAPCALRPPTRSEEVTSPRRR